MGLPIERLVIATNSNDILARTLETGRYEMADVQATLSPSMDIQISSNFERLLFDLVGRDAVEIERMMEALKTDGGFDLTDAQLTTIRDMFVAGRLNDQDTQKIIADTQLIISSSL